MTKIVFSGFGGQGILTLGQLVATIAMQKGKHVTWMPSYGIEMRGGTANCGVVISDQMIGSPFVLKDLDMLCALNAPSLDKFLPRLRPGGLCVYNSSIITAKPRREDVEIVPIDATNIAARLGNSKVQNMAMLAGFLNATTLFSLADVRQTLEQMFQDKNPALISLNLAAVEQAVSE